MRTSLLKKVMEVYPEAFEDLPKPKLRLVQEAVMYAGKISIAEDVLSDKEHRLLVSKISGKTSLTNADRLKAYRLRSDLNQVQLAKKTGISQSNIAAMETGKRPIGLHSAKKLAKALKCDFRQLV